MSLIKVGVIGIGNMGRSHAKLLAEGMINGAILTAVCDSYQDQLESFVRNLSGEVQVYRDEDEFLNDSDIDAVLISTPHYDHPSLAMKAFSKGLHVLIEKPAGVYTKNVVEMNEAALESGKVFGIMYNQRSNPIYQKLREIILSGELGEIKRTNWIITDWYRSQSYYDSSEWRATWQGEGGGVLLNQAPHQLDLWQWTTGLMPKKVHAYCSNGKYHDIEVEDDITAYVEYENGATGVFITSTGEAPGTNRFEIAGDRGKIVVENNKLTFYRLTQPEREFNATFTGGFGKPEGWTIDIPIKGKHTEHQGIIQNWIESIKEGKPLLAPGEEGIKGLEISNAIYLSSWLNEPVELPINAELFYEKLQEKINHSTFQKKYVGKVNLDVAGTH
ncbi:Gfo/Idh/MocA family protein [Metabacillus halosaccharovorans]|uniref:Gfo/Idh/MocA family protein n=1 Tax=Metabacillus halosaccharovorans TaxID=930124 RepID=UPI001C1F5A75|nr:Gfo/Idh/MocA family oxidoreductase [Metabacillus halosaccharovorans]MBU7591150.1 Gfo/Idh/MocA family oxidoreductase [Metabacillus halosaccharovorans]